MKAGLRRNGFQIMFKEDKVMAMKITNDYMSHVLQSMAKSNVSNSTQEQTEQAVEESKKQQCR